MVDTGLLVTDRPNPFLASTINAFIQLLSISGFPGDIPLKNAPIPLSDPPRHYSALPNHWRGNMTLWKNSCTIGSTAILFIALIMQWTAAQDVAPDFDYSRSGIKPKRIDNKFVGPQASPKLTTESSAPLRRRRRLRVLPMLPLC